MGGRFSRDARQSSGLPLDDSSDSGEEIPCLVDMAKVSSYCPGKGKPARKKQEGGFIKHRKPRVKDVVGKSALPRSNTPIKGDMDSLKMKTLEIFSKIPSYKPYNAEEVLSKTKINFESKSQVKQNPKPIRENLQQNQSPHREERKMCVVEREDSSHSKKPLKSPTMSHISPMNFFLQLDIEINELMMSSYQLIKKMANTCEFIRIHIQTLAQNIFNGTFCL
eukprot:TRINITY_DN6086_c0_g2_i1.p1 TRINITY_DN6086_c0_g2~~TRINITY_DN6086_c0_g2_i1.p1  ORF type:complete len:222 (+),score=38.40 TRINITY_DN6086_c0_g2_i1:226-891(+)